MSPTTASNRATGHLAALKELAIKAIKGHPNYRGKPLTTLPSIIDRLVQNKDYVVLATELEKKQAKPLPQSQVNQAPQQVFREFLVML